MDYVRASGKICFCSISSCFTSTKKKQEDARLFITFRPGEKISNEISATAGYDLIKIILF
jgi:hypothetical protein